MKEYDLEHYDEDKEDGEGQSMAMFGNVKNLAYYDPGEKDPYITLPQAEDLEDDREELQILPTDNLVLATKTEDDVSYLEVYVYDDNEDNGDDDEDQNRGGNILYVHHDIMLPSFPLCVEWLDFKVGKSRTMENSEQPGNFAAIGTFEPEIEIWNLDVVDSVYPDLILGQQPENDTTTANAGVKLNKKKKKKLLQKRINDEYHVDAVLSLSANTYHRNLLASGSADTTVKLWDLNNGSCAKSFQYHDGKVSSVAWNPKEGTILLSGGYDHYAIVSDLRIGDSENGQRKWKLDGDVEGLRWGSNGQEFYVSTEHGRIHKFDARNEAKSIWTLQAHDSEVTSFDVNDFIDGYMITGSTDKTIKLWNLSQSKGPSMILSRDLDVGKVFSVSFGPDKEILGHVIAAGSNGKVKVWDTMTNKTLREAIGKQKLIDLKLNVENNKREKIAGVNEDDEDDEDDEQGEEGVEDNDEDYEDIEEHED